MPELPEVETVRRGLAPAMEGASLAKVEVRDRRLRWPIAKDFEKRLTGQTVEGLGRRAKYLLADLSSGEVLIMHLGMSGSFRVGKDARPGVYYHEKSKSTAHDHVVFHMSNGATVTFNDPRRFGSMKLVARAKLDQEPLLRGLGPEPLGNEFDARMLAQACAGKKTSLKAALLDQRVVAGLATSMSARRCSAPSCRRNGRPRRLPTATASRMRAQARWSRPSRRYSRTPSRPAARRCATTAAPTARSAISSTISGSMTAKASPARTARAKSNASCRAAARPSIARSCQK